MPDEIVAHGSVTGDMIANTDYTVDPSETITVVRPPFGNLPRTVTFTADLGSSSGNAIVIQRSVQNQDVGFPPNGLIRTFTSDISHSIETGLVVVNLTWALWYIPDDYRARIYSRLDSQAPWAEITDTGQTGEDFDAEDFPHAGGFYIAHRAYDYSGAFTFIWGYRIELYGGETLEAVMEIATPFYGTISSVSYP